jgi:hypothetical protein
VRKHELSLNFWCLVRLNSRHVEIRVTSHDVKAGSSSKGCPRVSAVLPRREAYLGTYVAVGGGITVIVISEGGSVGAACGDLHVTANVKRGISVPWTWTA